MLLALILSISCWIVWQRVEKERITQSHHCELLSHLLCWQWHRKRPDGPTMLSFWQRTASPRPTARAAAHKTEGQLDFQEWNPFSFAQKRNRTPAVAEHLYSWNNREKASSQWKKNLFPWRRPKSQEFLSVSPCLRSVFDWKKLSLPKRFLWRETKE